MATHKVDVAVVGTGPGGYVSAIRCAQLGLSVAAVEDDRPGGVCLNWGCIPTKALLRNAEVVHLFKRAGDFGIRVQGFEADYAEAIKRSRGVADRMAKGVEFLFRKNKITLVPGSGTLARPGVVEVKGKSGTDTIEARAVILATGSEPKSLPGITIDEKLVISSNGAVRQERAPKSLIVIGAGAVGVEFADVYAAYGTAVTILEALPRLVPIEDEEVSTHLARSFTRRDITSHCSQLPARPMTYTPGTARAEMRSRCASESCDSWDGSTPQTPERRADVGAGAHGRRPRRPREGRRTGGARRHARPRVRQGLGADGDVGEGRLRHR